MICENCRREISDCNTHIAKNSEKNGERSWFITLILAWTTGNFGFHRFYTGYTGIGIAQALTFGGFGFWTLIDIIFICLGKFKTKEGKLPVEYVRPLGIALMFVYIILFSFGYILGRTMNLFKLLGD